MAKVLEDREGRRVVAQRRGTRLWTRLAPLVLGALAITALSLPVVTSSASFVWNVTPSAPQGLYRIDRTPWRVGDRVAVMPADTLAADLTKRGILPTGRLLIKRVVAAKGDTVCRHDETISINGFAVGHAKRVDSQGGPLPSWQGCSTLYEGQVFLLGDTAGSYDGRYFGVTQADEIVGRVDLLFDFRLLSFNEA